ncbi:MAG: DNA-packaging protein [Prevotella sp.]|jgi:hypothetical protein|nr:DNA-packaging protein [Prevotella sp.]
MLVNYEDRKDFLDVVTHIREVIRQNQIEGACVGAYNSNIISRILGLAEKKELSGQDGKELIINVNSTDTKDKLKKLQQDLQKK